MIKIKFSRYLSINNLVRLIKYNIRFLGKVKENLRNPLRHLENTWLTLSHIKTLKRGKALQVRRKERQVTFGKWKERLSGSSKGEWTLLLIHNLKAWLERGHGQMNFYLTQVISGHGAFNVYLFHMKLVESPKCANCGRRGWDDDAWQILFIRPERGTCFMSRFASHICK